jgi:hypothetical protein
VAVVGATAVSLLCALVFLAGLAVGDRGVLSYVARRPGRIGVAG